MSKAKFDCLKCVGYCCSIYERVEVTDRDLKRLAKHFGVKPKTAARKFTHIHPESKERVLKRVPDRIFEETCMFLDQQRRVCTIYDGRPQVCRDWPAETGGRCHYYDLLQFERRQQGSDDVVPIVEVRFLDADQEE